jgi:hypothetical protein
MKHLRDARIVLRIVTALALFSSSGIATGGSPWEPIEASSRLFQDPSSRHVGRDVHLNTKATVARWTRRSIVRAAYTSPAPAIEPRGVLIGLVALAQGGPTFASIANGGGSSINSCSTQSAPADQCSVINSTNSICSAATTDLPGYCSASSGSAPQCSTLLSTSSSCSAAASNSLCSTSTGFGGGGSFDCSVVSGAGTCSTLSPTGLPNTGSSCTALTGQGASASTCSVSGTTGGTSCSALNSPGNSGFCSVQSTGQPPDFCSVSGTIANPPNTCTLIGTGGSATCSVGPGSSGSCSVKVGGVTKVCRLSGE